MDVDLLFEALSFDLRESYWVYYNALNRTSSV
jgi:hypothetical protein